MDILFFLVTVISVIFAVIFYKKYVKLKKYLAEMEAGFADARMQQEAFSVELAKSMNELTQKPSDSVTGLPGRIAFDDRLQQTILLSRRYQKIFGLISLDLDHFSEVNRFGEETGDLLLAQVAKRLLSCVRQVDSVSRYAGDNFLILLPQLSQPEMAIYVAQRIQENFLKPFSIGNNEFFLSACMGIAIYPVDADTRENLVSRASAALQEAKQSGKNSYRFYHQEIHARGKRELMIAGAIQQPNVLSRLVMHYFPCVDAAGQRLAGVEAVPCLQVEGLGEVFWPEFMRVAENSGKTIQIMEWLIQQIELTQQNWGSVEVKPWFAVSLASRMVENTRFVFRMCEILEGIKTKHADPLQLVFELTDIPSQNHTALQEKGFSDLLAAGVKFSVELQLIGRNTLQNLTFFKPFYLKIKPEIVRNFMKQPESERIFTTMMDLSRNAGIPFLVGGVEDEQQKKFFKDAGCDFLSGPLFERFFFSRDGTAKSLTAGFNTLS